MFCVFSQRFFGSFDSTRVGGGKGGAQADIFPAMDQWWFNGDINGWIYNLMDFNGLLVLK